MRTIKSAGGACSVVATDRESLANKKNFKETSNPAHDRAHFTDFKRLKSSCSSEVERDKYLEFNGSANEKV